ncbi:MAG: hypothetical protein OEZ09_15580 [Betaproteobacteria bacterium]|nr:hypothetical protein [Betaproteobacteria bacterium]
MSRAAIIACSATKVHQSGASAPAWCVYDGPAWRTLRAWWRHHPVAHALGEPTVLALSAEYGLISASARIAHYDRRMTPARVEILATDDARERAAELLAGVDDLVVFGAALYVDLARRLIPDRIRWRRAGASESRAGGIGHQLGALRRWLDA